MGGETRSASSRDKTEFRRSFCKKFGSRKGVVYKVDVSALNPDFIVTASADATSVLVDTRLNTAKGGKSTENGQKRLVSSGSARPVFSARFVRLRKEKDRDAEDATTKKQTESHVLTHSADGNAHLYRCDSKAGVKTTDDGDDGGTQLTPERTYIMPRHLTQLHATQLHDRAPYFTCTSLLQDPITELHTHALIATSTGEIICYRIRSGGFANGIAYKDELSKTRPTIGGRPQNPVAWKANDMHTTSGNSLVVACSDGVVRIYENVIKNFTRMKRGEDFSLDTILKTNVNGKVTTTVVDSVKVKCFVWAPRTPSTLPHDKKTLPRRELDSAKYRDTAVSKQVGTNDQAYPQAKVSVTDGTSLFVGYSCGDVIKFNLESCAVEQIVRLGKTQKIGSQNEIEVIHSLAIPQHRTKLGNLESSGGLLVGFGNGLEKQADGGVGFYKKSDVGTYDMELYLTSTGEQVPGFKFWQAKETPWHTSAVHKIAYREPHPLDVQDPQGDIEYRVVTACADGGVRVFQLKVKRNGEDCSKFVLNDAPFERDTSPDGKPTPDNIDSIQPFYGHQIDFMNIVIDSSDKYLVACRNFPTVVKYDMLTGAALKQFDIRNCPGATTVSASQVNHVHLDPNDKFLLTCSGGSTFATVAIWDFITGDLVAVLGNFVMPHMDGDDLVEGKWRGHTKAINECVWEEFELKTGQPKIHIYTASDDGTVRRWDATEVITRYRNDPNFLQNRPTVEQLEPHDAIDVYGRAALDEVDKVYSMRLSKVNVSDRSLHNLGAKYVFVAGAQRDVIQFSVQTNNKKEEYGKRIQTFQGHTGEVNAVTLTSDNKFLVSASDDCTVWSFVVETGQKFRRYRGGDGRVVSLRVTPNDDFVLSATSEGDVTIHDFYTAKKVRMISIPGNGICHALKVTTDKWGTEEMDKLSKRIRKLPSTVSMGDVSAGKAADTKELDKLTRTSSSESHLLVAVGDSVLTFDLDGNTDEVQFGGDGPDESLTGRVRSNSLCLYEPKPACHEDPTGCSYAIFIEADRGAKESAIKIFDQHLGTCVYDSSSENDLKGEHFGAGCLWHGCPACGVGCLDRCTTPDCDQIEATGKWCYAVTKEVKEVRDPLDRQRQNPRWNLFFLELTGLEDSVKPTISENMTKLTTWNTAIAGEETTLTHYNRTRAIATSADYTLISTGDDVGRICVLNTKELEEGKGIQSCAVLGERNLNVDEDESDGEDDTNSIGGRSGSSGLSSQTGLEKTAHDGEITSLQFRQGATGETPDLFSAAEDGQVKQWGEVKGLKAAQADALVKLDSHSARRWVQVARYDEDPKFLSSLSSTVLSAFRRKAHLGGRHQNAEVYAMAIETTRAKGAILVTAESNGIVRLYNIKDNDVDVTNYKHVKKRKPPITPHLRFQANVIDDAKALKIMWDTKRKEGRLIVGDKSGMVSIFEYDEKNMLKPLPGGSESEGASRFSADYDAKIKVVRPKFTMKFDAAITSFAVAPCGSARLLVGTDRVGNKPESLSGGTDGTERRCRNKRKDLSGGTDGTERRSTLISLPQLQCLLFDNMIPTGFLRRMALVDASAEDPQRRFENAKEAIKRVGPSAVTQASSAFFVDLAREGIYSGLKKLLFDPEMKDEIKCVTVPFSNLYSAAIKAFKNENDEDFNESFFGSENVAWGKTHRLLLDELAASVKNHNDVLRGLATPRMMYTRFDDDGDLVRVLSGENHDGVRTQLIYFLDRLPLMIAPDAVRGKSNAKFKVNRDSMLSTTSPGLVDHVWEKKVYHDIMERRKLGTVWFGWMTAWFDQLLRWLRERDDGSRDLLVSAVTLVCPLAGFGAREHGFLDQILRMRDVKAFGNASVVALIQDKWDRFGRAWHRTLLVTHVIQLVTVMWISVERREDDALPSSSAGFHMSWRADALHVVLASGVLASVIVECLQVSFGLTWYDYLGSAFNWLDWSRIGVTGFMVYIFFTSQTAADDTSTFSHATTPANPNYDICVALSIFLHWFGFLDLLKGLPDIGVVVEMMITAVFDLTYYILIMIFLIIATSTANLTLYARTPNALHGFIDHMDGVVTTYQELVLSDLIDKDDDVDDELPVRRVYALLLVVSTFLVTIIILNLIIAKLSDSYKTSIVDADMARHRYQGSMIKWIEGFKSKWKGDWNDTRGRKWLHVTAPFETTVMDHGRWDRKNEEVSEAQKLIQKTLGTLSSRLDEVSTDNEAKIEAIAAATAGLDAKLDSILAALSNASPNVDSLAADGYNGFEM